MVIWYLWELQICRSYNSAHGQLTKCKEYRVSRDYFSLLESSSKHQEHPNAFIHNIGQANSYLLNEWAIRSPQPLVSLVAECLCILTFPSTARLLFCNWVALLILFWYLPRSTAVYAPIFEMPTSSPGSFGHIFTVYMLEIVNWSISSSAVWCIRLFISALERTHP